MTANQTTVCPTCHAPLGLSDRFCESCGHCIEPASQTPSAPEFVRQADTASLNSNSDSVGQCPRCGGTAADRRGACMACGKRFLTGTEHLNADLGQVVMASDIGLLHDRNEDAMAAAVIDGPGPAGVVAVVCDGISTVSRPEEAAAAAVQAGLDALIRGVSNSAGGKANLLAATAGATRAVAALDTLGERDPPACTYVAATVTANPQGRITIAVGWIGDSRAYWLSEDPAVCEQLTQDDSWAAEMVRFGLLDERAASLHPNAHAITRWIGSDTADDPEAVRPNIRTYLPERPGVLLLCTDGLWNHLPGAAELAAVVFGAIRAQPSRPMDHAVRTLVQRALQAGGEDNITAVLIEVRHVHVEQPLIERTTQ